MWPNHQARYMLLLKDRIQIGPLRIVVYRNPKVTKVLVPEAIPKPTFPALIQRPLELDSDLQISFQALAKRLHEILIGLRPAVQAIDIMSSMAWVSFHGWIGSTIWSSSRVVSTVASRTSDCHIEGYVRFTNGYRSWAATLTLVKSEFAQMPTVTNQTVGWRCDDFQLIGVKNN